MKPVFQANSKILVEREVNSEKSLLFRMNLNLIDEKHDWIKSEIEIIMRNMTGSNPKSRLLRVRLSH